MSPDPLTEVLESDSLRAVYQPIVDLFSGETVGYEALARGPEGPLESPASWVRGHSGERWVPAHAGACYSRAALADTLI